MEKLDVQHKHILRLVNRDRDEDGWALVSEKLFPVLVKAMPKELIEFEPLPCGGRARLTEEGAVVVRAMPWLVA